MYIIDYSVHCTLYSVHCTIYTFCNFEYIHKKEILMLFLQNAELFEKQKFVQLIYIIFHKRLKTALTENTVVYPIIKYFYLCQHCWFSWGRIVQ